MKRLRMLVAMALLMAGMLVASATTATALPVICPCDSDGCPRSCGVPVPRTVCELLVDEDSGGISGGIFEWRPGGVCWVNWGAAVSGL
jgi:hypothetical protein